MTASDEAIDAYVRFWIDLKAGSPARIDAVMTEDVRFKDPFNDVRGRGEVRRLLEKAAHRFQDLAVEVRDRAVSGDVCYLRWTYSYRLKEGSRPGVIEGMSEVRFAPDGRVAEHIDHWDAASQVYERVPVLGAVLRAVRRRVG